MKISEVEKEFYSMGLDVDCSMVATTKDRMITDEQLKELEEAYEQGDSKRINEACRDLLQAYREQQHLINSQQRQIFYLKSSTLWREHQAQQELIEEQKKEIERLNKRCEVLFQEDLSNDEIKKRTI